MIHKGLYFEIYSPIPSGQIYLGRMGNFESFSFETLAIGGFWSADISLNLTVQKANDWYENGLGKVLKIFDHRGSMVWEGFVNQVTLSTGSSSETRGPLLDVINRTSATYTPRDFTVYPPVDGSQTVTLISEDTISQQRYGIFEDVISAGTTTEATAIKVRDRHLAELTNPKTTSDISISPSASNPLSVTLSLLGKVHWLMVYVVYDTSTAIDYLSTKLKAILAASPNAALSTSTNYISDNLYLVSRTEEKLRKAWDIISELLSLGAGASDDRYIFGVYENGMPYYNAIPTDLSYEYRLSDNRQGIKDYTSRALVYPWNVRPGRWITISDFLIGRKVPSTNLFQDPRNKFIESVRFSAPFSVDLSGGNTDRLSQMLAKVTYSGGLY